jgi:methionyl-tRNA formyltransferase
MAKIIFMGTPDFAVPTLQHLIEQHTILGVITQPDRPAGRGNQVQMSPIKQTALAHNLPVFQPERLKRADAFEALQAWQDTLGSAHPDLYIVAAFGQILPQRVLDIPLHGSINVHASLLPRWRGAAPIQASIRAGDQQTGVTIMRMDAGLDTGDMISQRAIPVQLTDTGQTLHDKLAQLGADLLTETLPAYLSGIIKPTPQPEIGVTYAPTIRKEEGRIDWTQNAQSIDRLVRAFSPWPGTFTHWQGKQLKILSGIAKTIVTGRLISAAIGEVLSIEGRVMIGTGAGLYYPQIVQMEGKKALSISEFVNGYPSFVGTQLS